MEIYDYLYKKISQDQCCLYQLWEPDGTAVVIGYSQVAYREVFVEHCRQDVVPIIRRRGGGGAVTLIPGILCLSIAFKSDVSISPYYFFQRINEFIIYVLENDFKVKNLKQQGISDVTIGDEKVLGCSIFKSKNTFFYQGSLLVDPDMSTIVRYLKFPSKQPDYRNSRPHNSFITSLRLNDYDISVETLKAAFAVRLEKSLTKIVTTPEPVAVILES